MVGFAPEASTTACGAEKRVRVDVRSANGLRDEPVEEQPASFGRATVEAEGELVEVVGQVLLADGTLMRPQAQRLRSEATARRREANNQ